MPNDRFFVVDQPTMRPGACVVSGASGAAKGPYIDLGRSIPGYGRLYICADMLGDINRVWENHVGTEKEEPDHEAQKQELESIREEIRYELGTGLASIHGLFADGRFAEYLPVPPGDDEDAGAAAEDIGAIDDAPVADPPATKRKGRNGVSGDSGDESSDPDNIYAV